MIHKTLAKLSCNGLRSENGKEQGRSHRDRSLGALRLKSPLLALYGGNARPGLARPGRLHYDQ